MYINFYGDKIEYAVKVPVLAYKINVSVEGKEASEDVLGETILKLLNEGEYLDIDEIVRLIGIPFKYRKLVEYEINELLDNNRISIDDNNRIQKVYSYEKCIEDFYVLYDKTNKIFCDCIIPSKEFERRYLKKDYFDTKKSYTIESNLKPREVSKYSTCYKIQELITKSNSLVRFNNNDDEITLDEDEIYIRPFYKINLDTIENIDNPIDTELLIKSFINQNQDIEYEDPFTLESSSVYLDTYIKNHVDENKLYNVLYNHNEFMEMDRCRKRAQSYIDEYNKYDDDEIRLNYVEKVSLYRELLLSESDIYKKFSLSTMEIDKIVKSILKDIVENFKESKFELRNIKIKNLDSDNKLDNVNKFKLVKTISNQNYKIVHKDRKVINSTKESSISSYLSCIFMSKYFTNDSFENKVFELFAIDTRLIEFLNNMWLYRNNTSHNIEKQKLYDSEFDMENMYKGRLLEVTDYLIKELLYFVETTAEYRYRGE